MGLGQVGGGRGHGLQRRRAARRVPSDLDGDSLDDWGRQRELPSVRIISVDDDSHVLKLMEFSRRVA